DGRIAYTGSHNVAERTYGRKGVGAWIDLSGRFLGPVVGQLQLVFLDDWEFETDEHLTGDDLFPPPREEGAIAAQVVPTGPNHAGESFRRVVIAAMNSAQRRIIITTPYLVLDDPTMLALSMAADRGVETDIVIPERGDHPLVQAAGRSYLEPLLEAGVNVHLHRDGMLHAKTVTIDDAFALLGSANLDIRSFFLNFELNVLLYGPEITQQLRFAQQGYLSGADRVGLSAWRQRPLVQQYTEAAAALFSPLL
ncbi:MAG: phospholipase D-like domain-containing protein, partial [Rhodospirillales bacterium]|nr:phospholipase D-like domain-containing protein [Rhodospirillales bacterium]